MDVVVTRVARGSADLLPPRAQDRGGDAIFKTAQVAELIAVLTQVRATALAA